MPKESNLGFNVGLFVLVAFIGLSFFIFSVSDSAVFSKGKIIKTVFGFANGLKKNAPVRIAGVDQGIVRDIKLFFDRQDSKTKVEIDLWLKKDAKIPIDSAITINQLGLMGEKYVEIIPGKDNENFLQENEIFVGKDPISQEAISQKVLEVANKLEYSIAGINNIIHDEQNKSSIKNILTNLSDTTGNIKEILENLKSGKGTIGKFMYDDSFYNDIKELGADLKANPWKLLYKPKNNIKRKRKRNEN